VGVAQRNSKGERHFGCCTRIYHYLSRKVREKVDAKISEALRHIKELRRATQTVRSIAGAAHSPTLKAPGGSSSL